jgi:TPR repeat protein
VKREGEVMTGDNMQMDPYTAWENGDLKLAFRLFVSQAATGDSGAQLNLGYFYDLGLGTRKNREKAMR